MRLISAQLAGAAFSVASCTGHVRLATDAMLLEHLLKLVSDSGLFVSSADRCLISARTAVLDACRGLSVQRLANKYFTRICRGGRLTCRVTREIAIVQAQPSRSPPAPVFIAISPCVKKLFCADDGLRQPLDRSSAAGCFHEPARLCRGSSCPRAAVGSPAGSVDAARKIVDAQLGITSPVRRLSSAARFLYDHVGTMMLPPPREAARGWARAR